MSRAAYLLAAFALVGLAEAPLAQTSEYATLATISATMGVNGNRLCLGEASRGDIGCPTYAPFVNSIGDVGLGTTTPMAYGLHLRREHSAARLSIDAPSNQQTSIDLFTSGNGQDALGQSGTRGWHILARGKSNLLEDRGNLVFYHWNGTTWYSPFSINDETGNIGVGVISPSAKLTVFDGEIQTASSGAACTGPLAGAIRYTGGNLSYCNGSAWTLVGGASGGTPGGVSGSIQFNSGGAFAGRSDVVLDSAGRVGIGTTNPQTLLSLAPNNSIGVSTVSGSDNGYLNLTSAGADDSARGARITMSGVNRGTFGGMLELHAGGTGARNNIEMYAGNYERLRITPAGNVGIATTTPNATLEIAGRTSTTVLQLGESNEGCTTATVGTIRRNPATGRFQICRM